MNNAFKNAKWIWVSDQVGADEYGEFFSTFYAKEAQAKVRISCDGDYTLFVNGKFAASNQYGDFEHYKIYDEIDISEYLKAGENEIFVLVWHVGRDFSRYINAQAGVIYEVEQGGEVVIVSDARVLCRKSEAYRNGYCKQISNQLGFSFLYDSTKEGTGELVNATPVNKNCTFFPRPIKKQALLTKKAVNVLKNEGNYYLVDLGEETVGLALLEFFSETEQKITVAWGEDLQGGHVRRIIGNRDFSFEYVAKPGKNEYVNYMLRLGGRYLELYAEAPIKLNYLGVIPQIYEVEEKPYSAKSELDQRIYDICVRTLKLSMMEHYVDTPWREQCLYAFDSRNQMLCGYRAFVGGNAEYARSNLLLISKDRRPDDILSICFPCGTDLTIPSFSLYYVIAVSEYLDATGDVTLAEEVYPKLISITEAFLKNMKNGLIYRFEGKNHWNFYDWTEHLSGNDEAGKKHVADLMINCLFVLAMQSLEHICKKCGRAFYYGTELEAVRRNAKKAFFDADARAYSLTEGGKEFCVLGNALAILSGIADNAPELCDKIASGDMVDCTLSMKCFKYDALLLTDREKWRDKVADEIRREYKVMLDSGATSVWETAEGAPAFHNAGSLCHGWSAIPILYL